MGSTVAAVEQLPPHIVRAHDEAVARGDGGYFDPDTGLFVMTATALAARGKCCGSGCRHCPYSPAEQRAAGRPVTSPTLDFRATSTRRR